MSVFDPQQQATIDELIEGVNASRDAEDARALALYAQQLDSFICSTLALQGLRDAKTIVESTPILLARVNIPYTYGLLSRLRAAGADVKLVSSGCGYRYAHEVYQYFEGKSL